MNIPKVRRILTDHMKFWTQRGLNHLNKKAISEECFHKIMFHANRALEALEEEPELPVVYLCGNSARQVLRSHVELAPPLNGATFLFEYEDRIIENRKNGGVNFVREDIIDIERWGGVVAVHTEKFVEKGITIEYTLADGDVLGYGDYKKAVQFLKPYKKHIICEAENEFLDDDIVDKVIERIRHINDEGMVSSAGAWGNSHNGEKLVRKMLGRYQPQIITMHRPYPPEQEFIKWITYLKGFNKPIIENEFLMDDAEKIEKYARLGFDMGLYGFNNYLGDHLELMGKLCQEFN